MQVSWHLIANEQQLNELVASCQGMQAIALDTEFVRTRTYHPRLGLVQLATEQDIYLIDPLAIDDLTPLNTLLANPKLCKVMHACNEDLELFYLLFNQMPNHVWDTQIAASHLGQGSSMGLARLLAAQFDVTLSKEQTQSDWCARPLTQAQLDYAALDVAYLLPIYQRQQAQLAQRQSWVVEDSQYQMLSAMPTDPYQAYMRVRAAAHLRGAKLWLFQQLLAWRETLAREKDLPRGFIIKDPVALNIALKMPGHKAALAACGDLPHWLLKHHSASLLQLVEQAKQPGLVPPAAIPGPLNAEQNQQYQALKRYILAQAKGHGIPEVCLLRRKLLEQLLQMPNPAQAWLQHPYFYGWRKSIIGQGMAGIFNTEISSL